ncbi:hypothetical protein ACNQ2K_00265 [Mycoplasma sp. VS292A]|uniref:hypothetical protein n=1 Tax=Mycoplasma sp. VS292A TaxID=3401680 RepID=UPI003AACB7DF
MKQNKDFLELVEASLCSFNKLNEVITQLYESKHTWECNKLVCSKNMNLDNSKYKWELSLKITKE